MVFYMEERLQKYLANQGIGSRRKCEQYILDGRVKVNGVIVTELGTKVNPDVDEICFDGKKVNKKDKKVLVPARSEVFLKQFRKILEYRIQDKIQ